MSAQSDARGTGASRGVRSNVADLLVLAMFRIVVGAVRCQCETSLLLPPPHPGNGKKLRSCAIYGLSYLASSLSWR